MEFQSKSFCTVIGTLLTAAFLLTACAHNKQIMDETKPPSAAVPSAQQVQATQNYSPEMKRKIAEAEQLKKLQVEVYELQDRVYGNTEYGSMGLYGALRECKLGLVDKKNGGGGTLQWSEPVDRVADQEHRMVALEDTAVLEKTPEVNLLDRQKRFQDYRAQLSKHEDDFEDKLEICRGELKAHKDGESQPAPGIQHNAEPDTQEPL